MTGAAVPAPLLPTPGGSRRKTFCSGATASTHPELSLWRADKSVRIYLLT